MIWHFTKLHVANMFSRGRGVILLREHVLQGFYGIPQRGGNGSTAPEESWKGITPELCQKCIDHVHTELNKWIENDGTLKG